MAKFFSDDISEDDVRSPIDIMSQAAAELTGCTSLDVKIRQTRASDRLVLSFDVYNVKCKMSRTLFEVTHRLDAVYPASITPPDVSLPMYLLRSYTLPSPNSLFGIYGSVVRQALPYGAAAGAESEKPFVNHWICSGPKEFTSKLISLLATDSVKSLLFDLIAQSRVPSDSSTVPPENCNETPALDGDG